MTEPAEANSASAQLKRGWEFLKHTYGSADPRSMGALRIAMGLLLFEDVARRYPDLEAFYTNAGWLTNHFALFRPMSSHLFSVYHAFSTVTEVKLLFFAHCLVNLLFMLGWKTRIMHVLAAVLITSLNSRNIVVENGGYVMLNLLVVWTMFLPLGQRFSIDAWSKSFRERREMTVEALSDRTSPLPPRALFFSLAVTAVILQWVVNYYFNTVQKTGPAWRDGSAIHYFAGQERLLRPMGVWLHGHVPHSMLRFLSYSTLVVEGSIVVLLLSPFRPKAARMLAWGLGIGLHLSIAAFAVLGPFAWVMMTPYFLLIAPEYWDAVAARVKRRLQRRVVAIDSDDGLSTWFGRIIKRLDTFAMVEFVSASGPLDGLLVRRLDDEREHRKAAALTELSAALPIPKLLVGVARVVGMLRLSAWLIERAWKRRSLRSFFGLDRAQREPAPGPTGFTQARARWLHGLGQIALLVLLVATGSQVLVENRAVPARFKPKHRPAWMTATVIYPRLFQGWSMFAPEPPRVDGLIIVDGRTRDGRKLDPLTGAAPDFTLDRPGGPRLSALWNAFHMRFHERRFAGYYPGFRDYLLRHHTITGKKQDQLTAFDVWYAERQIAAPGQPRQAPKYRKLVSWGHVKDSDVPKTALVDKTAAATQRSKPKRR